jgi:glycosyltransferase involved in cell wall biosynthesis
LKIALFVHCFFPDHFYGTETYTLELAKSLKIIGHEVTVVSAIFQGERPASEVVTTYEYDGIPVMTFDKNRVPHSRILETYYQPAARPYLRAILEQLRPDLVHVTHLINHTAVLLDEIKALRIPAVATLTDFFGFCFNNKLERADGRLCAGPDILRANCISCFFKASGSKTAERWGVMPAGWRIPGLASRLAYGFGLPLGHRSHAIGDLVQRPDKLFRAYETYNALIAPSSFLRKAYLNNGFPEGKLHLSHFGVDIDRRAKPVRARDHPLILGYIGQIASHKGVDLLLRAARSIPSEQLQIMIYGPQDQDITYMKYLSSVAGDNVRFYGTFPPAQMADVLAQFDVLAIPSTWYENSPLVLLNALASHTPVIVSDVLGLTEFIEPGVSGWRFERANEKSLRQLLHTLLEDGGSVIRKATHTTSYERTSATMCKDVDRIYKMVMHDHGNEQAMIAAGSRPSAA